MKNLICFVIIMFVTLLAAETTLVVDQFTGPYYTINSAYNDAVDGDTVLIYPATYMESINISKAITLEGIDPYSTIIQSNTDYAIKISNGDATISKLRVICSDTGIEVITLTPLITECIIENCPIGVYIGEGKAIDIKNCIINNCTTGIEYYCHWDGSVYGNLVNNIIKNCSSRAIYFKHYTAGSTGYFQGNVDIINNIILDSTYGIETDSRVSYNGIAAYNCFYNNSTNAEIYLSDGNIFENPLFVDLIESNFYLHEDSPCIDTGNPVIEFEDLDSTRNDMGIFGGPQQWGSGNPTVMDIQITPESVTPVETFDIEATGQVK